MDRWIVRNQEGVNIVAISQYFNLLHGFSSPNSKQSYPLFRTKFPLIPIFIKINHTKI